MLKPTVPHLRRLSIRPGHWGQWLATGTAGLVGFVVLALLLVFETEIGQLDQRLLSGVISLRSPGFTAFASAVTRLGSATVVVPLGIAAAVILGLRSGKVLLPIALLATLAAPRVWSPSSRSRSTARGRQPSWWWACHSRATHFRRVIPQTAQCLPFSPPPCSP